MQPSIPGVRHALEPRYRGPYVITDLTGSSAEIKGLTPSFPETVRVHINQLKPAVAAATLLDDQTDEWMPGESTDESSVESDSLTVMSEERTKVEMDASFEDQMAEIQRETAPMEDEAETSAMESNMEVVLMPEAVKAQKRWMTEEGGKAYGQKEGLDERVGTETPNEPPDGTDVSLPTDSSEDEAMGDNQPNPYEGMGVWTHPPSPTGLQQEDSHGLTLSKEVNKVKKPEEVIGSRERSKGRTSGEKRGIPDKDEGNTDEYGLWVTPSPLPPKVPRVQEAEPQEEVEPSAARVVPRAPDKGVEQGSSVKRSRSPGSETASSAKKRPMNERDKQMQS